MWLATNVIDQKTAVGALCRAAKAEADSSRAACAAAANPREAQVDDSIRGKGVKHGRAE